MALITSDMVSTRKSKRNCLKLARYAYFWGQAYFYFDGHRMAVSFKPLPEIEDLFALRTGNQSTIDEIAVMFEREIT